MTRQLDGRNKYDSIFNLINGAFDEHFSNENNLKSKLHKLRIKRNDIIHKGIDASKPDCEREFKMATEAFECIYNTIYDILFTQQFIICLD